MAIDDGQIWLGMRHIGAVGAVERLDLETGEVLADIPVDIPARIVVAFGSAWVTDSGSGNLYRFEPDAGSASYGQDGASSGRTWGNVITSRIDGMSVRTIVRRSIAEAHAAGRGHAVFEGHQEVLVERVGLLVAAPLGLLLGLEPAPLVVGVGELGVGRADLHAGDDQVEVLGDAGAGAVRAGQR